MPRENRKRGRRANASKRKRDAGEEEEDLEGVEPALPNGHEDESPSQKRQRTDEYDTVGGAIEALAGDEAVEERPFFGMLDEQEQEYFKRADEMLEVNQFSNLEERALFLENLHKEVQGKELKIACSQSCSRLMERLIVLSSPAQLRNMFAAFNENLIHLIQHRFASHCCEALFIYTAAVVSQELLATSSKSSTESTFNGESESTAERLFLDAVEQLKNHLGYLMTDRYGSHALRVLLLVLAGQPLETASRRSLLKGKGKEGVEVADAGESTTLKEPRPVPGTFTTALQAVIEGSVAGLDTHHLRTLATHKTGNPTLQLLLTLELQQFGKQHSKTQNSILRKLLPDEPLAEDSESGSFLNGLTFDPIGSRLLEAIIEHAPAKMFKPMYKTFWKDRMGSLARNEISAYVVARLLTRLSFDDLQAAMDLIIPQIPSLVERGRTSVIRILVERCSVRKTDTGALAQKLQSVYQCHEEAKFSLAKMLDLPSDSAGTQGDGANKVMGILSEVQRYGQFEPSQKDLRSAKAHAALLVQSMASVPGPLSEMVFDALAGLPGATCLYMARDPTLARVLQAALASPQANLITRRKLIVKLYGNIGNLAIDPSGSHVVDAIWNCTANGMAFVRERVAEELQENEQMIRQSSVGRKVWKNWQMDLYKRRRVEWVTQVRRDAGNVGFQSFPGGDSVNDNRLSHRNLRKQRNNQHGDASTTHGRQKTAIERARERFAKKNPNSSSD